MPHLSPMGWISLIIMFWLSLSLLASTFWWSEPHLFSSSTKYSSMSSSNSWKWLLQDGRD